MASASTSTATQPPVHPTARTGRAASVSPAQLTIVVVCVVSVYFLIGFYGKSLDGYRISQRAEQVRREVAELEARNKALQEKVAYYATEGYVETAARDKLNLVKPGDYALVVVPEKQDVAWVEGLPAGADRQSAVPEFGHLDDWVALFLGWPATR